jgi:histidinol-phosphate aminotransferase
VSGPAIASGIAALGDLAHLEVAVAHNEIWRECMREALSGLGLRVTPSATNFLLVHFPGKNGHSATEADRFLHTKHIILRKVEEYGFPEALRLTIGSEGDNLAVLDALASFMGES